MNTPHLTSALEVDRAKGLRFYRFRINCNAVKAAMESQRLTGDTERFKERMGSYVTEPRKPGAKEILSVKIGSTIDEANGTVEVTLIIKEGHFRIAEFIKAHPQEDILIHNYHDSIILESLLTGDDEIEILKTALP